MSFRRRAKGVVLACACALTVAPALAQQASPASTRQQGQTVRVTGIVSDESNGITLPGVPVETVDGQVVYTDVDGRYLLQLAPGRHEIRVALDGYDEKTIALEVTPGRTVTADVGLRMMRFS